MRKIVVVWSCLILALGASLASAHGAEISEPGLRDKLLAFQAKASSGLFKPEELSALAKVLNGDIPSESQAGCEAINALVPIFLAARGDRKLQRATGN